MDNRILGNHVVVLEYVENENDIMISLHNFNEGLRNNSKLGCALLSQTIYWVYDPINKIFGPNKFVGYKQMTFDKYDNARSGNFSGLSYFNAGGTRKAIEGILGKYEYDNKCIEQLSNWAESMFPDITDRININKWRFNHIH